MGIRRFAGHQVIDSTKPTGARLTSYADATLPREHIPEHRVGIASRKSQSSIQNSLRFYPLNYEISEYFAGLPKLNPIHAKAHPLPLVFRNKVG